MARYVSIEERQAVRRARITAQVERDKQRMDKQFIPRGAKDHRQSLMEVTRADLRAYAKQLEASKQTARAKVIALQEIRNEDRKLTTRALSAG